MAHKVTPSLSFSTSDSAAAMWVTEVPPICRPIVSCMSSAASDAIISILGNPGLDFLQTKNRLPDENHQSLISCDSEDAANIVKVQSTATRLPIKKRASGAKRKLEQYTPMPENSVTSAFPLYHAPLVHPYVGPFPCPSTGLSNPGYLFAPASQHIRPFWKGSEALPPHHAIRKFGESAPLKKRKAAKCKIEDCQNTVVQGGKCLQHGAKRKACKHRGCTKNVKQAGMCSAHGPARKRCKASGCENIAVQAGVCISHGAQQKLCSVPGCTKKSKKTFGYMCKLHYDTRVQTTKTNW